MIGSVLMIWNLQTHISAGIMNYRYKGLNLEWDRPSFARVNFTYEQLQVCEWIAEHTDDHDRIVTVWHEDYWPDDEALHQYITTYTINGIFASRFEDKISFEELEPCDEQVEELLEEKGIQYIVVDVQTSQRLELENIATLMYKSDQYEVYYVR